MGSLIYFGIGLAYAGCCELLERVYGPWTPRQGSIGLVARSSLARRRFLRIVFWPYVMWEGVMELTLE